MSRESLLKHQHFQRIREPEQIITACKSQGQQYSIISPDDLIIPPDTVVKIE